MSGDHDIDQALRQRLRGMLDDAAGEVDELTAARLRAARLRAVERAASPARLGWRWLTALVPAGAIAALVVVLAPPSTPPAAPAPRVAAAPAEAVRDLDLLTAGENLDLYQDLDFYLWLPPAESS